MRVNRGYSEQFESDALAMVLRGDRSVGGSSPSRVVEPQPNTDAIRGRPGWHGSRSAA
jgi:hypothetical protein